MISELELVFIFVVKLQMRLFSSLADVLWMCPSSERSSGHGREAVSCSSASQDISNCHSDSLSWNAGMKVYFSVSAPGGGVFQQM